MTGRHLFHVFLPLALVLASWTLLHAAHRFEASLLAAWVEADSIEQTLLGRMAPTTIDRRLRLLDRSSALDPTNVTVPLMRGSQHLLLRNPEAALRWYGKALELEPRAEIYFNMGRAHRMTGDDDKAATAFRKAVRLDPKLRRNLRSFFEQRRRARAAAEAKP